MAWNKQNKTTVSAVWGKPPYHSNTRTLLLLLVLLAAVAVGVGAYFLFYGRAAAPIAEEQPMERKKMQTVDVTPQIATNRFARTVKDPKETERKQLREKVKAMTPEERQAFAFQRLKEKKLDLTPTTNHPFRTGIERSMAQIFMTVPGNAPPPIHTTWLPIQDEAHLEEILNADNPVLETDSDRIKEAKVTVEAVKKELKQYIKDGGDVGSFLAYYHDKLNSAFEERRMAMKEVVRVARESPEIAPEFYAKINERLASKGILTINFNEKAKAKLGLERTK